MIDGNKTVIKSVIAGMLGGAVFGILLGALTGNYLLWVGLMVVVGAGFGTALAYGFLPESEILFATYQTCWW